MISIIVAVSDNLAIGRAGDMPWHISADLKYFKRITLNHTVIMGRRTWESIGSRPLKNRRNIVVSSTLEPGEGFEVASSLKKALEMASGEEVFIMGGGRLYAQAISVAERLYVTHVHTVVEDADTFFPEITTKEWLLADRSETETDPASGLTYEFTVYDRKEE
ncbi:MAG: dihydrofolate reductase [Bacteroidales bacterium]|nr:dihydrofolate reductase [Bacteroidales bacterium]